MVSLDNCTFIPCFATILQISVRWFDSFPFGGSCFVPIRACDSEGEEVKFYEFKLPRHEGFFHYKSDKMVV